MRNSEKTISANSKGIVVSYGDVNKHMFTSYNRSEYVRKIQLEGTKRYQKIEVVELNPHQTDLYHKIVYGFTACTNEELNVMSTSKRMEIKKSYTIAQRIFNRWKQNVINENINSLFSKLFPSSPVTKAMVCTNGYDDTLDCSHISFRELGITRKQIIDKLIEFNLLPQNFYNLA
jgi:hypothetical protein